MRYADLPHNFQGTCARCGSEFSAYSPPSRPRKFCSPDCGMRSQEGKTQSASHVARRSRFGADHPAWKGDDITNETGRSRALRWFPNASPCEKCGGSDAQRHHADENPKNNDPTNIRFLCRPCHLAVHDFVKLGAIRHGR